MSYNRNITCGIVEFVGWCIFGIVINSCVARISKLEGHTGNVARRSDAGVGFLGRGSAAGPLPIS